MPFFTHDCNHCIYLGSIRTVQPYEIVQPYDFYYCPNTKTGGSCIIRDGNNPEDNQSFPWDIIKSWKCQDSMWALMKQFVLTHIDLGTLNI